MTARYIVGDTRDVLATLPDNSVDLVFTSPPFLALRSYLPADHPDKHREIGSEPTPAGFLDTLLDVVEACDRVLAPHGSLVFELGDTYSGSGGAGGDYGPVGLRAGQNEFDGSAARTRSNRPGQYGTDTGPPRRKITGEWPLDKSLCFIPTLFGASLAYGRNLLRPERTTDPWRIRNLIVWCRPNPPVGALGDKVRPATSYLTVACKARDRYFDLDAVRGPGSPTAGAPPLDYWEISTQPYKGSHYATFPERLCEIPIKSMVPERVCTVCGEPSRRIVSDAEYVNARTESAPLRVGKTVGWSDCEHDAWRKGVCLDPFAGSGTTLAVAVGHGREAIGIDLDSRNAELARERVGLWLTVDEPRVVDTAAL